MRRKVRAARLEADRVVTVENLTAFYHFIAARPGRTVLVYLGGYHNRPRRELLLKLAEADDGYARRLAALRDAAEYAPFHGVIEEMLRLRRRVEQEAVPPPS